MHVYILSNKIRSVFYVGVTSRIAERLVEHKTPLPGSTAFTARYRCWYLLYYEEHQGKLDSIFREKQIKGYSRPKKLELIRTTNPRLKALDDHFI